MCVHERKFIFSAHIEALVMYIVTHDKPRAVAGAICCVSVSLYMTNMSVECAMLSVLDCYTEQYNVEPNAHKFSSVMGLYIFLNIFRAQYRVLFASAKVNWWVFLFEPSHTKIHNSSDENCVRRIDLIYLD